MSPSSSTCFRSFFTASGSRSRSICFVLGQFHGHRCGGGADVEEPDRRTGQGYISLFRSTPFLTQVYIIYYGCGDFFAHTPEIRHSFLWPYLRDAFWYGIMALSLNTAAYSGNILRGGLEAVPFGEIEAGRAFGMSRFLIFWRISFPRAIRIVLPTMSGETILLIKTTAIFDHHHPRHHGHGPLHHRPDLPGL